MTRVWIPIVGALAVTFLVAPVPAAGPGAVVTVRNPLSIARPAETIVISALDLQKVIPFDDIRRVHVRDLGAARELLTQAVDLNDDGKFEEILSRWTSGPATRRRSNSASASARCTNARTSRPTAASCGSGVTTSRGERPDRAPHVRGGLETWAQEPLTSSAVDVWTKRVRRLVINDWYMVDDYHRDNGTEAISIPPGRAGDAAATASGTAPGSTRPRISGTRGCLPTARSA